MIHAALSGKLARVPTRPDPVFRVLVPQSCDGVPSEVLRPRDTWPDPVAYDRAANDLAGRFEENFERFASIVDQPVREAGPARKG